MASKRAKLMLGNGCMFLAPIVSLKLAAMWFSAAPPATDVQADPSTVSQTTTEAPPAPRDPKVVQRQAAAARYVQSLRAETFGNSPFYYEPRQQVVHADPEPEPEPEVPGLPPVPKFIVQVIMASEAETKALIDGKIYRIGDEFRGGWIIEDIDGFARTVTITEPATGRTSTQAVRMPGER